MRFQVRLSFCCRGFLLVAALIFFGAMQPFSFAYMPPPHPCELEPMTYGPPEPPTCAGPPPLPTCGPCPPMRIYPRKLVGPPPWPIMVCKLPVPTPADYKIEPPPACPPPCAPPPCGPQPTPWSSACEPCETFQPH